MTKFEQRQKRKDNLITFKRVSIIRKYYQNKLHKHDFDKWNEIQSRANDYLTARGIK